MARDTFWDGGSPVNRPPSTTGPDLERPHIIHGVLMNADTEKDDEMRTDKAARCLIINFGVVGFPRDKPRISNEKF